MEIRQVELAKCNSVRILFVLERPINRKLHYRRDVSEYNVLRVKSVFAAESVPLFNFIRIWLTLEREVKIKSCQENC